MTEFRVHSISVRTKKMYSEKRYYGYSEFRLLVCGSFSETLFQSPGPRVGSSLYLRESVRLGHRRGETVVKEDILETRWEKKILRG